MARPRQWSWFGLCSQSRRGSSRSRPGLDCSRSYASIWYLDQSLMQVVSSLCCARFMLHQMLSSALFEFSRHITCLTGNHFQDAFAFSDIYANVSWLLAWQCSARFINLRVESGIISKILFCNQVFVPMYHGSLFLARFITVFTRGVGNHFQDAYLQGALLCST
jgi:hypothetical protein